MLPGMMIPGVAIVRAQQTERSDGLVVLRSLYLSFVTSIVLIGVVVLLIGDVIGESSSTALGIGIVVVAAALSFAVQQLAGSRLDVSSDQALANSYRTRFFLRVALSEAIALIGFVVGLAIGPWWAYYVGAVPALVALWRMAPSRGHLAAQQDALSLAGSSRSLVGALRTSNVMTTRR